MRLCQQHRTLCVQTPAKLNLFLDIHGKRPDGFHELTTLMVAVGLFDTLHFEEEESEETRLFVHDAGDRFENDLDREAAVPTGPENLILRAAKAVQDYTGTTQQARISVWKRIPVQSGMAGGSSDAAATLVGLNRFWQLGLSREELFKLGAELGSDVNFFLAGSSAAICRGRGEIIEPIALPACIHFVVVRPSSGLSTPAVFRRWNAVAIPQPVESLLRTLQKGHTEQAGKFLHNALQAPAEELNADITTLRNLFETLPVSGHRMTGSGTAYFGLCRNQRITRRLAAWLKARRVGRVFATHSTG